MYFRIAEIHSMIRVIIHSLLIVSFLFGCQEQPNLVVTQQVETPLSEPLVFPHLPEKMTFAGETISLQDVDLIERLDREVLVEANFHSATTGGMKRAYRFFPVIERILKEEGIPQDFKYLAVIESNLLQAVSPAGARGIWQFMSRTADSYGLKVTNEIDERLHLEKSTYAACKYLKDAYRSTKDWLMAAAAYNRGVGGVMEDMEWQGTDNYFDTDQNSETGRYVFRMLAVKLIYENPEAYGYYPERMQRYEPLKTKTISVTSTIPNVAEWALSKGFNFKIIQKLNPWIRSNRLTIKHDTLQLELPSAQTALKPYKSYSL